jgi:hypothetical protein
LAVFKKVGLAIHQDSWAGTGKVFPFGSCPAVDSIDYLRALLWIGVASVPVNIPGWMESIHWAQLRYFSTAMAQDGLKLRLEAKDLDAHHKTVLSDDWGVGFALQWLDQQFGYTQVAHGAAAMKYFRDELGIASYVGNKKRGPQKCPDFFAIDPAGKVHVIECKGTQSGGYTGTQLERGEDQKKNVRFDDETMVAQRLVTGLFIAKETDAGNSTLTIVDPPADGERGHYLVRTDNPAEVERGIQAAMLRNGAWLSGVYAVGQDSDGFIAGDREWVGTVRTLRFERPLQHPAGASVVGCRLRNGIDRGIAGALRKSVREVDLVQDIGLRRVRVEADLPNGGPVGHYAAIRHGDALISDWQLLVG